MCRTGCPTPGAHDSWGACLRSAKLQVGVDLLGVPRRQAWDRELTSYASAVAQGIQPEGTRQHQIDFAVAAANELGTAA